MTLHSCPWCDGRSDHGLASYAATSSRTSTHKMRMNWIQEGKVVLLHPCSSIDASYERFKPNWQSTSANSAAGGLQQPAAGVSIDEKGSEGHQEDEELAGAQLAVLQQQPTSAGSAQTACLAALHQHGDSTAAGQHQESVHVNTERLGKRKRSRKSKKEPLSQQELDARHPGNARNRIAQAAVLAAWHVFKDWLHEQHHGQLDPAVAAALQRWQQAPAVDNKGMQQLPAADVQTGGPQPASDWVALFSMRGVLQPKVSLVQTQDNATWMMNAAHQHDSTSHAGHTGHTELASHTSHTDRADQTGQTGRVNSARQQAGCRLTKTVNTQLDTAALLPGIQHNLFRTLVCNPWCTEVVARAHDTPVLLPPNSAFLMTDLSARNALQPLLTSAQRFKVIVADPPWENASVKRSGRYQTLPSRSLLQIPMQQLLHQEAGVLLLWMTNREKLHRFVHQELLPAWGLTHAATWFWLKVAAGGSSPVSSLTSMHRHPFEHLLVCVPKPPAGAVPATDAVLSSAATSLTGPGGCPTQQMSNVEASVPKSSIGSGQEVQPCIPCVYVSEGIHPAQDSYQPQHDMPLEMAASPAQAAHQPQHDMHATSAAGAAGTRRSSQPSMQSVHGLPEHLVLLSVPAAEHSHKPHLGPLIRHVLPDLLSKQPSGCLAQQDGEGFAVEQLELFAREMHAGWVSVGNEVLRFQDVNLFTPL